MTNSIAIMQPYVFPYIGYFQLIKAADFFVFLDDVNFIKKGWINRNYLYSRQAPQLFTIPLSKVSQNQTILDTRVFYLEDWPTKLLKQIDQVYSKAPYFKEFYPVVESVFKSQSPSISDLAILSIAATMNYLSEEFRYALSSDLPKTDLKAEKKIIAICEHYGAKKYFNPIGGAELYQPTDFAAHGIELLFLQAGKMHYPQYGVPTNQYFSMIDVLMFNSVSETKSLLLQGNVTIPQP